MRSGCVVLRGSGHAFRAGADIGGIGAADAATASRNFQLQHVMRYP